ncbi:MAG: hypothetical protein AAF446_07090, partial [Pseudomonadota bacterium]
KTHLFALFLSLFWLSQSQAEPRIELVQSRDAVIEDQRLVGNSRAQAKRRGTIRSVPQLYVYHTDQTAAYHLEGYREGFTRYLDIAVRAFRQERSMVDLDKLLERAHLPLAGENAEPEFLSLDDLPTRDVIIVFYHRNDCAECLQVEQQLALWLEQNDDIDYTYLRVSLE